MSQVADFDVAIDVKNPSAGKRNGMIVGCLLGFFLCALIALVVGLSVGLTSRSFGAPPASVPPTADVTTSPLTVDLVSRNWTEILRRARGTSVRWWFWGLDTQINDFVDQTYGTILRNEFQITFVPVHLNDTFEALDRVSSEFAAGNLENGSVDLIWINGENFFAMKSANHLFGPFADKLPLSNTVDWTNSAIAFDFGEPVDYFESVWSQAQYQFVYLPSRTATNLLPRSFNDWLQYARSNPGRVSYIFPNKGDFLAARFLKQALIELAPRHYLEGQFNQTKYNEFAPLLWAKLNSVKPFLWQNGTSYPSTFADQDFLFLTDELDFTSTHDVAGAQTNIDDGHYPAGSKAYIWHTYSIGDFNYVAIPRNAANKAAALVLANLLLRPDRQALQKIPAKGFGLGFGVSYNSLKSESQVTLDLADQLLGDAGVSSKELATYLVGDLTPSYHNAIVKDWLEFVGGNATAWIHP